VWATIVSQRSTRAAERSLQNQEEQARKAQASQIMLFYEGPAIFRGLDADLFEASEMESISVRNYSPLPALNEVFSPGIRAR